MSPPTILLDIDGVFSPWHSKWTPEGYEEHVIKKNYGSGLVSVHRHNFNPSHGKQLARMIELGATLVWCTLWEMHANRHVAPILGIDPLKTIIFKHSEDTGNHKIMTSIDEYKLESIVEEFDDDHPLCWIDDDIGPFAQNWAKTRSGSTLLIKTEATIGVLPLHFEYMEKWIKEHTPVV